MSRNHESVLYLVDKEPVIGSHPKYATVSSRTFVFRTRTQARRFRKIMNQRLLDAARRKGKSRPEWRYGTPRGASWGPDMFSGRSLPVTKEVKKARPKPVQSVKLIPIAPPRPPKRPTGENLLKKQGKPTTLKKHVKRLVKGTK